MTARQPEFFFDTADLDKTKKVWNKISSAVPRTSVRGFTTNPNALHEAGIFTLAAMENRIKALVQWVSEVRGEKGGLVYVQVPNSRMSLVDMKAWINYVRPLGDGITDIAIKLPPQIPELLDDTGLLISRDNPGIHPNITGVADHETAINAFEKGQPEFVSLIWGRMQKVVDPGVEFSWTEQERKKVCPGGRIIAGSLRDLDTLKGAIAAESVPTIGFKFWDQMGDGFSPEDFLKLWSTGLTVSPKQEPEIKSEQLGISRNFFETMDNLGEPLRKEFTERLHLLA